MKDINRIKVVLVINATTDLCYLKTKDYGKDKS